jgi:hypothetical protein
LHDEQSVTGDHKAFAARAISIGLSRQFLYKDRIIGWRVRSLTALKPR